MPSEEGLYNNAEQKNDNVWIKGITASFHSKCCPADQTRPDDQDDRNR